MTRMQSVSCGLKALMVLEDVIFNAQGTGWLDQVVTQGFDAAYLDIVDAYFFWGSEFSPTPSDPALSGDPLENDFDQDAAQRMVDFIVDMTAHARQTNPSFFVIPQNGQFIIDALADDAARKANSLNVVGAIGVEDTYYVGDLEENNPFAPDTEKIAILQQDFLGNNKPVFCS